MTQKEYNAMREVVNKGGLVPYKFDLKRRNVPYIFGSDFLEIRINGKFYFQQGLLRTLNDFNQILLDLRGEKVAIYHAYDGLRLYKVFENGVDVQPTETMANPYGCLTDEEMTHFIYGMEVGIKIAKEQNVPTSSNI